MQIEIKIDETCKEPKIVIHTPTMTEEITELVKKLTDAEPQALAGFKDGQLEVLQPETIARAYAADQKVYVQTDAGTYLVRLRLYELEERLDKNAFVRISNSEIVNLRKVASMDLSFSGTICIKLHGNTTTYVSRRYVAKIKQILGV
jgi:DNA-binding LytR/AlgR family response regulator